jgi:hypothetical protein
MSRSTRASGTGGRFGASGTSRTATSSDLGRQQAQRKYLRSGASCPCQSQQPHMHHRLRARRSGPGRHRSAVLTHTGIVVSNQYRDMRQPQRSGCEMGRCWPRHSTVSRHRSPTRPLPVDPPNRPARRARPSVSGCARCYVPRCHQVLRLRMAPGSQPPVPGACHYHLQLNCHGLDWKLQVASRCLAARFGKLSPQRFQGIRETNPNCVRLRHATPPTQKRQVTDLNARMRKVYPADSR